MWRKSSVCQHFENNSLLNNPLLRWAKMGEKITIVFDLNILIKTHGIGLK